MDLRTGTGGGKVQDKISRTRSVSWPAEEPEHIQVYKTGGDASQNDEGTG